MQKGGAWRRLSAYEIASDELTRVERFSRGAKGAQRDPGGGLAGKDRIAHQEKVFQPRARSSH